MRWRNSCPRRVRACLGTETMRVIILSLPSLVVPGGASLQPAPPRPAPHVPRVARCPAKGKGRAGKGAHLPRPALPAAPWGGGRAARGIAHRGTRPPPLCWQGRPSTAPSSPSQPSQPAAVSRQTPARWRTRQPRPAPPHAPRHLHGPCKSRLPLTRLTRGKKNSIGMVYCLLSKPAFFRMCLLNICHYISIYFLMQFFFGTNLQSSRARCPPSPI